jgi:lipopolysaccharide transport system permease protein
MVPEGAFFWRPAFQNWAIIRVFAWRQISMRYRGSALGFVWPVITPLIMLGVYTLVFSVIFHRTWQVEADSQVDFAMFLFAGLICHQFLAECINRGPNQIFENKVYVKKVVFPLQALSYISVLTGLFNFLIGLAILLVMYVIGYGLPPVTTLLLPLAVVPLVLLGLGVTWLFSVLGVFFRDMRHLAMLLVTVLLFMTPIFYPMEAVPDSIAWIMLINPMASIVTVVRDVVLVGKVPDAGPLLYAWVSSLAFAAASSIVFMRVRKTFADVV